MKRNKVIAFGLVLGFSASTIFADTTPAKHNSAANELADKISQVQRQAIEAKSRFLDVIGNSSEATGKIETMRVLPKSNGRKKRVRREPKPPVDGRKKSLKEKINLLKKIGKTKSPDGSQTHRTEKNGAKKHNESSVLKLSKREKRIYNLIMNAGNLESLTPAQKSQILALHKRVLKTKDAQILLETIQVGEGGGPLVIVGKGYGKSKRFKQIMNRLNFSTHPVKQFPKGMRCFVFNRQVGRCSTASGSYQITETNYNFYARQFGLKDFSMENQQIIALELIRTGKAKLVRGNYKGRGYIELLKGNVDNAVRYGTNDWASSPYSEWGGSKASYLQNVEIITKRVNKEEKKMDRAYFQNWLDEFEKDTAS